MRKNIRVLLITASVIITVLAMSACGTGYSLESDHVYKCLVDPDLDEFSVLPEKTLDDVTRQGEIEGISFDKDKKHMLISYNRGAIIVKGMPTGFYDGYDKEIHEVFVYWCPQ